MPHATEAIKQIGQAVVYSIVAALFCYKISSDYDSNPKENHFFSKDFWITGCYTFIVMAAILLFMPCFFEIADEAADPVIEQEKENKRGHVTVRKIKCQR